MANLQLRLFAPVQRGGPVENATRALPEVISTSASNAISTAAAQTNEPLRCFAYNGRVKVAIGSGSPDASTATTFFLIPDAQTLYLSGLQDGHKIAAVMANTCTP